MHILPVITMLIFYTAIATGAYASTVTISVKNYFNSLQNGEYNTYSTTPTTQSEPWVELWATVPPDCIMRVRNLNVRITHNNIWFKNPDWVYVGERDLKPGTYKLGISKTTHGSFVEGNMLQKAGEPTSLNCPYQTGPIKNYLTLKLYAHGVDTEWSADSAPRSVITEQTREAKVENYVRINITDGTNNRTQIVSTQERPMSSYITLSGADYSPGEHSITLHGPKGGFKVYYEPDSGYITWTPRNDLFPGNYTATVSVNIYFN